MSEIKIGQIYAGTRRSDIDASQRQRRRVVEWDHHSFVWLLTENPEVFSQPSRVRVGRGPDGWVIPRYRLVEAKP